ncbi:PKD domain-containing protein, partial [Candidatus Bathyarchaeota archaeon]
NPSHSFAIKGTYQVRLNVTDGNNQRVSATHSVIVTAQTLTISGATGTPNPGQVNQPVTFSATITGGTSPYVVTWTFGDTTTGTGNPTTHSYTAIGTFTVTVVARDANAATSNTFTFTEVIQTTSLTGSITITDGSLCPLTNNQFALNFVNDPKSPGFFRLVSSIPGEFYDNVFVNGAAGTPVTLNINLPYPMVTKGNTSVQVFSGFTTMGGCFMPTGQLSSFTITGTPVTLSSYSPQNFGSMATIRVTGNMPSSGMLYVNVHMDYGLKKTTGWTQGAAQGSSFQALNPGLGLVLNNGQSYTFTLTGSASASASVTSVNQFKKDPGFGGAVTSKVTGNSLAGVTISIYDNKNNLLGITTTDQYGFYSFQYKYTGATKAFYVYASVPGSAVQSQIQITTMETNQVVLANFEF